jgi:phospholipid-translocating ATPase
MAIACKLEAVACCRCTPTQKADVARMIKRYGGGKRVCCIGDGGNDVSMIQAADIGIGIVGKEGLQASLAADVSIAHFSQLLRLLLWHGRNSYRNTAKLTVYMLHRGFVFSTMQAIFSSIFYYCPISLFPGMLIVGYSTVFTGFPILSLVLDRDVSDQTALTYVELYKDLTRGRDLTLKVFFKTLMISVFQGAVLMMSAMIFFENQLLHMVSITFTALILNELLMVALEISKWHYMMILSELFSLLFYVSAMCILRHDFDRNFIISPRFLFLVSIMTLLSFLPLYIISLARRMLAPNSATKLQDH